MASPGSHQLISTLLEGLEEVKAKSAPPAEHPTTDPVTKRKNRKGSKARRGERESAYMKATASKVATSKITTSRTAAPRTSASKPTAKRTAAPKTAGSKTAWMMKGADETLHTILARSLQPATDSVSSQDGFEVLCSYNWLMSGEAILVPGGPPKWTPPSLPALLAMDSGLHFVDQNAYRVPQYPFEPAFQAIRTMNPDIRLDAVDIIVNRNSLRKLLDFAAGRRQEAFCMGLNMVQNTLFITRKERTARQIIHGRANSGYGHNFEEAFTTPEDGLDGSSSHHRVIRYRLGNLNCVVRFEVDAYYDEADEESSDDPVELPDDITIGVAQLNFNEQVSRKENQAPETDKETPKPAPMNPTEGTRTAQNKTSQTTTTQVISKGELISSAKIAEIKCRNRGLERVNEAMPQLWFGRTPYLLIGKATDGDVREVSCTHVEKQFAEWENVNQEKLQKLVSLLAELKRVMLNSGGKPALLVCAEKGGPLLVCRAKNGRGVLPKDMIARHWSTGDDKN